MKKLLTLLCILTFWSCSKDSSKSEITLSSDSSLSVSFTSGITTRVTSNSFDVGDIISVAAYDGSKAISTNTLYSYSGYYFNSDTPIEYESATQDLSFTAVYPSREGSIMSFDFEIAADQSVDNAYELSDMLVSVIDSTQERQPELLFDHVMSNVVINIISSDSFDDAQLTLNAVNNVSCDLANDSYTATGSATAINAATVDGLGLKAIVAPQSIAANTVFATLTVGERVYNWTLLDTLTFESGRQYSFNWDLAINEVSTTGIINGWGDSTSDAGTDIAYTRLADYSATSYPETAETWVIYDIYASTDNFDGLLAALNAVSSSTLDTREISIEFPNLICVPERAFYSNTATYSRTICLKRISLPSATIINSYAFHYCTELEVLSTPELVTIEEYAFCYCSSLNSVDLSKVMAIGNYAFTSCTSIITLTVDSIIHVGSQAFSSLTNLMSISLPKAEELGIYSFSGCSNLIDVNIPNVTTLNYSCFSNCSSLVSISIPKFTSYTFDSSTNSHSPFYNCSNLKNISIATESTITSCRYLFNSLSTSYITLTIGKSNAAYANGNVFTAFNTSGDITNYTFYEIIIAD